MPIPRHLRRKLLWTILAAAVLCIAFSGTVRKQVRIYFALRTIINKGGLYSEPESFFEGPRKVHFSGQSATPGKDLRDFDDGNFREVYSSLRSLPELMYLDLRNTRVGDASMPLVATLQSLWYVDLAGAEVTPEGVAQLSVLPHLRQVVVSVPDDERLRLLRSRLPRVDVFNRKTAASTSPT